MSVSIELWGVRLTDALRSLLNDPGGPKFDEARDLATRGDGQTKNLAKEFIFMARGLSVTINVLLPLLKETNNRFNNIEASSDLAKLLQKFREDLASFNPSDTDDLHVPDQEYVSVSEKLQDVLVLFSDAQQHLADEFQDALERRDAEAALTLLSEKETGDYLPLHDCMVRFMADSFSWVFRHFGEEQLLQFHLDTAEGQRAGFEKWEGLTPEDFAKTTAFLLKQHMGNVHVREDDEKFVITQTPCGSGGRFNLDGAYEGTKDLPVIKTPSALTFGKPQIPVYCSHCAIWNGTAPIRWFGYPQWVFDHPAQADGGCIMHIYKNPQKSPEEYIRKVSVSEDKP